MNVYERLQNILESPIPYMKDISLILLIKAGLILLFIALFSKVLIRFLRMKIFARYHITEGIQESISRLIHYVFIIIGALITLDYLGINMTTLAALSAVLMVGIGLGLQNITSNFISGLILIFERPIQVGDFVDVAGVFGKVNTINTRATTVTSIDNVSIIVPNSKFISESLVNWSYKDPRIRFHVKIGVSYGSDVDLVRDTLLDVGKSHPEVLKDPEPIALFYEFGESSLDFDLLVWIKKPLRQFIIKSDLNYAIVHAFREKGIEIPFPQRDLHIRSSIPLNGLRK
ncbi:mechanosensitive ion channel family protein [Candidatus Latescibacterota bacterium]